MRRFDLGIVSVRPPVDHADCDHAGTHSPRGVYSRDLGEIRYIMVCDLCDSETREVARESYRPKFDPDGNLRFLSNTR